MSVRETHDRIVRLAFGPDVTVQETGPSPHGPGMVEIHSGDGLLGSGRTIRGALADAISFTMPVVVRARLRRGFTYRPV